MKQIHLHEDQAPGNRLMIADRSGICMNVSNKWQAKNEAAFAREKRERYVWKFNNILLTYCVSNVKRYYDYNFRIERDRGNMGRRKS